MDKDKKLEEFFKNRVNDFDSTDEDWDLPDASVFQNAQQYFPGHPKKSVVNWKSIAMVSAGVLLLSLLGYVFYLNQTMDEIEKDKKDLKTALEIAQTDLQIRNNEFTDLQKQASTEISELKKQKELAAQTIKKLTQGSQKFQKTIQRKNNQIKSLTTENERFTQEVSQQFSSSELPITDTPDEFKKDSDFEKTNLLQKVEELDFLASTNVYLLKWHPKNYLKITPVHGLIPPKKKTGKLEFGLNYASLNYKIPWTYDFEKIKEDDFGKKEEQFSLRSSGANFHAAYAIRPNLWITTGFRKTSGAIEKSFITKLIYNKSGEYTDDQGKTLNEFEITAKSTFSDAGNSIDFEIPNGTDIEDGDWLIAKLSHYQKFEFIHLPVGVNYFIGKNRWQGYLKGGLGWNKVSFGEYVVDAELEYGDKILPINKSEKDEAKEVTSQFINGYAGVGLNYQLTRNWHARSSFSFEKNFTQSKKYLSSNALSQVLEVGLNFRF